MITLYFFWKTLVILLGLTAFKIQVLSMLAIKCWGDFRIFNLLRQYIGKKTAEDSSINLCILRQQWFWHTSSFFQWLWVNFLTDETTCSIAYLEHIRFGFFVYSCYSKRTHYPTLEKLSPQNIATCGNQSEFKQREFSDHWKSVKTFLKKINRGWRKKQKDWLKYKF